jgi:hypothetical protein
MFIACFKLMEAFQKSHLQIATLDYRSVLTGTTGVWTFHFFLQLILGKLFSFLSWMLHLTGADFIFSPVFPFSHFPLLLPLIKILCPSWPTENWFGPCDGSSTGELQLEVLHFTTKIGSKMWPSSMTCLS